MTIDGSYDLAEMRAKWETFAARLQEGDEGGSLFGAAYIIARSGCTDIIELLDLLEGALEATDD
jgi:hypothetical protein